MRSRRQVYTVLHAPPQAWSASIFVINAMFPSVSARILRSFFCHYVAAGNTSWLHDDYSMQCWQGDHWPVFWSAVFWTAVYPIGIPVCVFFMLKWHRSELGL